MSEIVEVTDQTCMALVEAQSDVDAGTWWNYLTARGWLLNSKLVISFANKTVRNELEELRLPMRHYLAAALASTLGVPGPKTDAVMQAAIDARRGAHPTLLEMIKADKVWLGWLTMCGHVIATSSAAAVERMFYDKSLAYVQLANNARAAIALYGDTDHRFIYLSRGTWTETHYAVWRTSADRDLAKKVDGLRAPPGSRRVGRQPRLAKDMPPGFVVVSRSANEQTANVVAAGSGADGTVDIERDVAVFENCSNDDGRYDNNTRLGEWVRTVGASKERLVRRKPEASSAPARQKRSSAPSQTDATNSTRKRGRDAAPADEDDDMFRVIEVVSAPVFTELDYERLAAPSTTTLIDSAPRSVPLVSSSSVDSAPHSVPLASSSVMGSMAHVSPLHEQPKAFDFKSLLQTLVEPRPAPVVSFEWKDVLAEPPSLDLLSEGLDDELFARMLGGI